MHPLTTLHGITLGSGTGVPSLRRNAPGYFLQANTQQFLIDCGSGTLLQLEKIGKSFKNLDALFITHVHVDHIGDLMPLIHALKLPGLQRDKPLTLYGPLGFTEFFTRFVLPVVTPPTAFPFQVRNAPPVWESGGTTIRTYSTPHSDRFASCAYRFESQKESVVFSGDTDFHPDLVDFCLHADLLLLDCSTLHQSKVAGHLSAALCGQIATAAHAKRLILTHFYPLDGPDSLFLDECRNHYQGQVELAVDLQPFTLQPDSNQTP